MTGEWFGYAAATLTTGNDNTSTTYAGVISGAGSLTKIGTGIFLLSGHNSYGGATTVAGGALEVVGQFKTGEEYGAIFGKGNGKKEIFDPIIQGLIDDGTVNGLIAKYLGGDPSTVPFIDVPAS